MLRRIRIHDARIPQDPVTALAPPALLALQRTAGNRAIAERLQLARAPFHFPGSPDPDAPFGTPAEPAPKPAQPGPGPEPPEWFKLNSDQGNLPGEAVPGITDVARPLTESDRATLGLLLSNRTKENGVSAPLFVTTFDAAARRKSTWPPTAPIRRPPATSELTWPVRSISTALLIAASERSSASTAGACV